MAETEFENQAQQGQGATMGGRVDCAFANRR